MIINILTLFPEMFESLPRLRRSRVIERSSISQEVPTESRGSSTACVSGELCGGVFNQSIIKRAQEKNLLKIKIYNLRDWATDKHKTVDDKPYGGGAGMVMKVEVIDRALHDLKLKTKNEKLKTILLTPQGKTFNQKKANSLSQLSNLILVCGHYEGFDERVRQLADEQISIGDYVLTGGEIPAMVLVDTIARLIPGVLGKKESSQEESFSMDKFINDDRKNLKLEIRNLKLPPSGWLEYPQYTRPESYQPISKKFKRSLKVPKVLLSGHHAQIKNWRVKQIIKKTKQMRA